MERIDQRVEEKQHNLNRKRLILEKIIALVESEENAQTLDGLRECMRQWREIGQIPKEFQDDIYKSYKFYIEKYYNQLSMFWELKVLDKDKNLEVKIDLIKRAEQLKEEPNIRKALLQLNKYHEDWENTGPVRPEILDDIWKRFKEASGIVIEALKARVTNFGPNNNESASLSEKEVWKKYITAQAKILEHKSRPIGIDSTKSIQLNGVKLHLSIDQEIFKQLFKKEVEQVFNIQNFDFECGYIQTSVANTTNIKSERLVNLKELAEICYIDFNENPIIEGFITEKVNKVKEELIKVTGELPTNKLFENT